MAKKAQPKEKANQPAKKAALEKKTARPVKKALTRAPAEYVFWCHDGTVFSDLYELAEGLRMMTDETFAYHSNLVKHDFSNWIRDILGDEELADALMMVTSRPDAVSCIIARINP
jgi:hypothetical protein